MYTRLLFSKRIVPLHRRLSPLYIFRGGGGAVHRLRGGVAVGAVYCTEFAPQSTWRTRVQICLQAPAALSTFLHAQSKNRKLSQTHSAHSIILFSSHNQVNQHKSSYVTFLLHLCKLKINKTCSTNLKE